MKKAFVLFLSLGISFWAAGQNEKKTDTVQVLENVIVNAFESNSELVNTPAAVSNISSKDLDRYDNTSILSALNTKPGVRMEERSPGSYRLNIRGSSLRSPFGISNVKVYYDGIPLTGPGGTTDLNMLGFYNFQSIEVIKGPAGSMYGAGTGGAVLIHSDPQNFTPGVSAGYSIGSFNTNSWHASARFGNSNANNSVDYQHLGSDGYRDHTQMSRDIISWNASLKQTNNTVLKAHFYYSDMYYQTPGGLTKAEYDVNPGAARPKAGPFPSAEEAKAAINDQAFLAGFSLDQKISSAWTNTTSVYGYYWHHNNPTFRNYTRRVEPNFGARTNFRYLKNIDNSVFTLNAGGEFQKNFITSRLYDNIDGVPGAMQTDDEINSTQGFVFAQATFETSSNWVFTAGASVNKSKVQYNSFIAVPAEMVQRNFKNELAPRVALLKKFSKLFSVYASVERGFSPPASSELLPTSGVFDRTLQAESGVNYELGTKGNLIHNRLFFDVSIFRYRLKNAIVQKQDAGGGIFYDNAGGTNQNGVEAYASYAFLSNPSHFFDYGFGYVSFTGNHFRFRDYKQLNDDFSGNQIAGIAPATIAAGVDVKTKIGLYGHLTYFYSDRIPLDDANTAFANAYNLIGTKIGYKIALSTKTDLDIFAGVQNMLDERYSLGNDINAAGGRYYNVAPGRSFFGGIEIDL